MKKPIRGISDHHTGDNATSAAARAMAGIPAGVLEPSPLVPRRSPGINGRRPPRYPDLNFQVIGSQLGISATHVGRILNGVCRPSMALAERLCALFGWSIDDLNRIYQSNPKHQVLPEKPHAKSTNRTRRTNPVNRKR